MPNTEDIPGTCRVAIEFGVPYTSSRIDFLFTGRQDGDHDTAVIVELKQWSALEAVPTKDAIVRTFVGGAHREVSHLSYQAWSYARMIEDYNEDVRDAQIELVPCEMRPSQHVGRLAANVGQSPGPRPISSA